MPKDEFDPDDPMELCGVGIVTEEDTSTAMAECFIEEFIRLGYNHKQILALFRNPHYTGMNMVLQNKGEDFVRTCILETFAKRGKAVKWHSEQQSASLAETTPEHLQSEPDLVLSLSEKEKARVCSATDPMGALAPDIHL
jgi:hypothetical protein